MFYAHEKKIRRWMQKLVWHTRNRTKLVHCVKYSTPVNSHGANNGLGLSTHRILKHIHFWYILQLCYDVASLGRYFRSLKNSQLPPTSFSHFHQTDVLITSPSFLLEAFCVILQITPCSFNDDTNQTWFNY